MNRPMVFVVMLPHCVLNRRDAEEQERKQGKSGKTQKRIVGQERERQILFLLVLFCRKLSTALSQHVDLSCCASFQLKQGAAITYIIG